MSNTNAFAINTVIRRSEKYFEITIFKIFAEKRDNGQRGSKRYPVSFTGDP